MAIGERGRLATHCGPRHRPCMARCDGEGALGPIRPAACSTTLFERLAIDRLQAASQQDVAEVLGLSWDESPRLHGKHGRADFGKFTSLGRRK